MKSNILSAIIVTVLFTTAFACEVSAQVRSSSPPARREVAVTFDDLPVVTLPSYDIEKLRDVTAKLVRSIRSNNVPAVGFVNETKLYKFGEVDARIALLRMWLDAGLELGNHTFSHPSLQTTSLAEYEENLIRGETVTSLLLREKGMRLRYFRYPFLQVGANLEVKRDFEKFLAAHGYTIAPVTIDSEDYVFAAAYAKAEQRGDKASMKRVVEAYLPYMEKVFEFYEKLSVDVLGYEVKQVFYIHANALNAECFDNLARMMKRRGYKFITLDQALTDDAYQTPDNHVGEMGTSWLHHWAEGKGMKMQNDPQVPEFVVKLSEFKGE